MNPPTKKLFRVPGTMTISMFVDVEAATAEEARELATDKGVMSLCHSCANASHGEWSTSGELDGEPAPTPDITEIIELGARRGRR